MCVCERERKIEVVHERHSSLCERRILSCVKGKSTFCIVTNKI